MKTYERTDEFSYDEEANKSRSDGNIESSPPHHGHIPVPKTPPLSWTLLIGSSASAAMRSRHLIDYRHPSDQITDQVLTTFQADGGGSRGSSRGLVSRTRKGSPRIPHFVSHSE